MDIWALYSIFLICKLKPKIKSTIWEILGRNVPGCLLHNICAAK